MICWMTMSCLQFILLFILVLDRPDNVRTEDTKSIVSFLYTGKTSTMHIEDTCFDINQASVNNMYLGISMFINNNTSCEPENIGLKEVQKYIIHDKHQRQLCRTKITVSINSRNCDKAIENLEIMCQHLDERSAIFFQDCMVASFLEKNETITESGAIIISAFPKPKMTELGHTYEIPTAHCNMKECKLRNANKVTELGILPSKDTFYPDTDKGSAQIVLNQAIVVGCVGLIFGVVLTSFVCICIYKHNQSRISNDGQISKTNIPRMTDTEGIFSIHPKEDEFIYHDIMDIKDLDNNKDIQHNVNDFYYQYDPPEQRYSRSPKSSTSTSENEVSISQCSMHKTTKSSKEHTLGKEISGMYYKLSKENNSPLTDTENEDPFESRYVDIENTATGRTVVGSLKSEHHEQHAAYEVPVSHSNAKISRNIGSKTSALSALNGRNEDIITIVYHVLEKENHPAT